MAQKDGQITSKAISFINEKTAGGKSFFLAVGLYKPHDPFIAPEKYFEWVDEKFGIEDYQIGDDLSEIPLPESPENWTRPNTFAIPTSKWKIFTDPDFSDTDKREFLRSYYACSLFMDVQVGKIVRALRKSDYHKNTLIVLLGDHGYHLGEHHQWNKNTHCR